MVKIAMIKLNTVYKIDSGENSIVFTEGKKEVSQERTTMEL
jgi:hypothetical protein